MHEPDENAKKNAVPGPGRYNTLELDSHGVYPISTVP
jgi:hypothetical protein